MTNFLPEEMDMMTFKKLSKVTGSILLSVLMVLPLILTAPETQAGRNLKGNGFPAGFHFNLNLLGKKTENPGAFSCPSAEDYLCQHDDEGLPVACNEAPNAYCVQLNEYGLEGSCAADSQNVVYIPRFDSNATDTTVGIQSGNTKGGKNKSTGNVDLDGDGIDDLQVTDWCTESFPDDASDGAIVKLPPYDDGYAVFARITGKPCSQVDGEGNCLTTTSFSNSLGFIQDDQGNDLLALGFVTSGGEWQSYFELQREQDGTKTKGPGGKGAKKASDISSAFTFTGNICYISPWDQAYYCGIEGSEIDANNDSIPDYPLPLASGAQIGAWFWDDPDDGNDGHVTVGVDGEDPWADVDLTDVAENDGAGDGVSDMLAAYILSSYTTYQGCDVNAYCYDSGTNKYFEITSQGELDACVQTVAADTASNAVPAIGYFNQLSDPNGLVADAPAVATCKEWTDEWIFQIADLVEMIWGIENNGSYNVQVRFYPHDQVCDQLPAGCNP
ncbi:MAG: hypothetical protein JXR18_03380 [Neptuniibacter sp.]